MTAVGSIPACAGEPCRTLPGLKATEVYPRVCGGTRSRSGRGVPSLGLSPRVRGNPDINANPPMPNRSIPACAGEPVNAGAGGVSGRVYPRVCGGTMGTATGGRPWDGLSPRVRGNRNRPSLSGPRAGSIPACAGEPRRGCRSGWRTGVYPRVCGGTSLHHDVPEDRAGLSPRVRGNLRRWPAARDVSRSIPACAGEPTIECTYHQKGRVYPRVCGGTGLANLAVVIKQGLSPRVRGNHRVVVPWDCYPGSIPACAGEPPRPNRPPATGRVYPRVCGGTAGRQLLQDGAQGLSPRVRGNPRRSCRAGA